MKAIAYLFLSFILAAALYRFNVNGMPLWACAIAGLAIVGLCWVGVRSLKTGGKKRDIAY